MGKLLEMSKTYSLIHRNDLHDNQGPGKKILFLSFSCFKSTARSNALTKFNKFEGLFLFTKKYPVRALS